MRSLERNKHNRNNKFNKKMTSIRLIKQMVYTAVAVERVVSLRDFIWSYAEVSWSLWSRFDLRVFHIVVILG